MNTASFSISELNRLRRNSGNAWRKFFDAPNLSMGVYHVPAGTNDLASHDPHDRDEVYVGISGKGRLTADGKEFDVEPGAIIFVKAKVEHHFHDVTDDLAVLVIFAGKAD